MSEHDFKGNQSGKPEWFSLVEADTRIQHNPRDRGFRIMALAGPLLLISTGLLFAQTNEGHNATAIESSAVSAPAKPGTNELASSRPVAPDTVVDNIATDPDKSALSSQSPGSPSTPLIPSATLANPGINQGFVAPAPSTTQSFSDDDDDSVGSEAEDFDESDDEDEDEDFDESDDD